MRILSAALGLALASAAAVSARPAPRFVPGAQQPVGTPLLAALRSAQHPIAELPGKYMVVLKPGVSSVSFLAHQHLIAAAQQDADIFLGLDAHASVRTDQHGIRHVYDLDGHLQGYAGHFTDDVLAFIRAQPEVEYVERDSVVTTQHIDEHAPVHWIPAVAEHHRTQKGAPWGLARLSHRDELGFSTFNKYVYDDAAGEGVTAYIIDTGIYVHHNDFEGRARWGKTIPVGDGDVDGHGHGTHCAGTIGSKTYGVAKKADLVAVKVLTSSGSGSTSDVTAGVLWAVKDAQEISAKLASADPATRKKHKGFVANMSLGGGRSPTLDAAVNGAVSAGVHFAVAAGNENADACNSSPASAALPITVGASDVGDKRAYFSNKGRCVDVFGPGLNIKSTFNNGPNSTAILSGTSMATPHTVGLLAYLLSIYGSADFVDIVGTPVLQTPGAEDAGLTLAALSALVAPVPLAIDALNWLQATFVPGHAARAPSGLQRGQKTPRPQGGKVVSVLAPTDLKKALLALATKDALSDVQGSPNLLLYNNATTSTRY